MNNDLQESEIFKGILNKISDSENNSTVTILSDNTVLPRILAEKFPERNFLHVCVSTSNKEKNFYKETCKNLKNYRVVF